MPENRFRVWCKNRNEWENDYTFLNDAGSLFHQNESGYTLSLNEKTHIIDRCIGRKDKAGKTVYESSIFKFDGEIYRIEYVEDFLTWAIFTERDWVLFQGGNNHFKYCYSDEYSTYFLHELDSYEFEIIGTKFENPELLTTDQGLKEPPG